MLRPLSDFFRPVLKKGPEPGEPEDLLALDPNVWTPSFCVTLAQQGCTHCFGLGTVAGRANKQRPCNCVFRYIFKRCFDRFRHCVNKESHIARVSLEANPRTKNRAKIWGLKNEEYIADFVLVARRVLDAESNSLQWGIFNFHYLLGADWKLCTRKLGIDRGEFFHEVYRVEQKLGRVFGQLKPYRLFPTQEYFSDGCATPGPQEGPTPLEQAAKPRWDKQKIQAVHGVRAPRAKAMHA